MSNYTIAQKNVFSALSTALNKALVLYEMNPHTGNFDLVVSLVEACAHAQLLLKPAHRKAVSAIQHYEKPYYFVIDPDSGTVSHRVVTPEYANP